MMIKASVVADMRKKAGRFTRFHLPANYGKHSSFQGANISFSGHNYVIFILWDLKGLVPEHTALLTTNT